MSTTALWTGGHMNPRDALDKLRADGFPVEDIDVSETKLDWPQYHRRVGESDVVAQTRYERDVETYTGGRYAEALTRVGEALLRMLAAHAAGHALNAEWRADKGNEKAVLALATEYDRKCSSPNGLAYVIGTAEMLNDVAKQGVHHQPGSINRTLLPGVRPRAFLGFMSTTLALCPVPDIKYPVIVAHNAYAIGYHIHDGVASVTVGIMPQRERVGVVGATAEQVLSDIKATMDAQASGGVAPTFDPTDFKTQLRLRRKLAAAGDNKG